MGGDGAKMTAAEQVRSLVPLPICARSRPTARLLVSDPSMNGRLATPAVRLRPLSHAAAAPCVNDLQSVSHHVPAAAACCCSFPQKLSVSKICLYCALRMVRTTLSVMTCVLRS